MANGAIRFPAPGVCERVTGHEFTFERARNAWVSWQGVRRCNVERSLCIEQSCSDRPN